MGPSASPSAQEAIDHISAPDEQLLNARLVQLSSLGQADLDLLAEAWPGVAAGRRLQIVRRLVDLAEDNVELNFDSVFKLCLKDPDESVRSAAIEGLWEDEEPSLIDPLITFLLKDSSPRVRAAAAVALGKFAVLAEHNKLREGYRTRIAEALLSTITSSESPAEVQRRALEAAAALSLPEVKDAIAEAYQSPDHDVKVSSVFAMGRSLDSAWVPQLLEVLSSPDAELRYEACGACGELEEPAAVPGLVRLTGDPDADVRTAAIAALGKIGTAQARSCLKKCLSSKDASMRQAAGQALGELAAKEDPLASLRSTSYPPAGERLS